ncbi:unnamed protein product, partial [Amoebophrya sp. A25]
PGGAGAQVSADGHHDALPQEQGDKVLQNLRVEDLEGLDEKDNSHGLLQQSKHLFSVEDFIKDHGGSGSSGGEEG